MKIPFRRRGFSFGPVGGFATFLVDDVSLVYALLQTTCPFYIQVYTVPHLVGGTLSSLAGIYWYWYTVVYCTYTPIMIQYSVTDSLWGDLRLLGESN